MSDTLRKAVSIETKCYTCESPIWVPEYDYSEVRNYCYPCACARLAM